MPVLYAKPTFVFEHPASLCQFLENLSSTARNALTRLAIKHQSDRAEDQENDRRWEILCLRIATQCTSLTHLSIHLTINKARDSWLLQADRDPTIRAFRASGILKILGLHGSWLRLRQTAKLAEVDVDLGL